MNKLDDKEFLRLMRQKVNEALVSVAKDLGLESMKLEGITYSDLEATGKLRIVLSTSEDNPLVKEKNAMHAKLLGLPEDIVGSTTTINGKVYEVIGFNINKPKYAVKIKDIQTDKEYGCTVEQALRGI
jgi:hypothetical protein